MCQEENNHAVKKFGFMKQTKRTTDASDDNSALSHNHKEGAKNSKVKIMFIFFHADDLLLPKGSGSNEKWKKVSYVCRCSVFLFSLAAKPL